MIKESSKKISTEDWEELEKITFSTIWMCLANQILPKVCIETMAKELWTGLENTYIRKNMTNKLWLKK